MAGEAISTAANMHRLGQLHKSGSEFNREQRATGIFFGHRIKNRLWLEMLVGQHDIVKTSQVECAKLHFTWWLARLFDRNSVNEQRIVALIKNMRRELHFDAVIRGEYAFFERNRFEKGVVG